MLEGDIREINLVDRLVDLWREKFTGAIRFENDGIIKIVYFKGGDVLSASTNDRADSVDEILMRAGKVTREHVKQALAKRKENETLGDALLTLGFITRKELTWGRRMQVISVIRSVGAWPAGSFTIVDNYLPKREEGTIFPLPQLIVEMIVTEQDRAKFERELDSGSAVFVKMPGFDEQFRSLGLNEDAEAVAKEVDGVRSASEVAAASRQETFNAFKLLHALTVLKMLHRSSAVALAAPPDDEFLSAGVSDATQAWTTAPIEEEPVAPPPAPAVAPPPLPAPTIEMAMPLDIPVRAQEETPQFGFDEGQIEAVRRATGDVPMPSPALPITARRSAMAPEPPRRPAQPMRPKPKKSRFGLLLGVMVLFILAGAAYGAYYWWNSRSTSASPAPAVVARPTTPKPTPQPQPQPVTETQPATQTVAVATQPQPVTQTIAPVTTSTAASVTASQAPVKSPSGATDRYAEMARAFAASPKGNFTVQFEIVCDPSNITKAISAGGDKVWFVPITLKGNRACYRVFWGNYETREAAERGSSEIPKALRETAPAVVTVPR